MSVLDNFFRVVTDFRVCSLRIFLPMPRLGRGRPKAPPRATPRMFVNEVTRSKTMGLELCKLVPLLQSSTGFTTDRCSELGSDIAEAHQLNAMVAAYSRKKESWPLCL